MRKTIGEETGKSLLINSGYRSPAYQMLIFLGYLKKNFWNIRKTMRGVALPGYSQHGYPDKQAIDFASAEILEKEKGFFRDKRIPMADKNAVEFGFRLSFPKIIDSGLNLNLGIGITSHYLRNLNNKFT